tara:strand:- start:14 stop:565 length:552 start_codon:yes stop_codon:yes gene_type:complete
MLTLLYFALALFINAQGFSSKYNTWNEFTEDYNRFDTEDVYIAKGFIYAYVSLSDPDINSRKLRNYKSRFRLSALEKISDYIYSELVLNIRWDKSFIERSLLEKAIKDINHYNYKISGEDIQTLFFRREGITVKGAYKLDIKTISISDGSEYIRNNKIVSIIGKAVKIYPDNKNYINWLVNKQ